MEKLITNNPLAEAQLKDMYSVGFIDTDMIGLLTHVRDLIHKGHKLLTHPLMGSVKPNESPYKSVLISGTTGETDTQSVLIVEECIQAAKKFSPKSIPKQYLKDLQMVDLSLINSVRKQS